MNQKENTVKNMYQQIKIMITKIFYLESFRSQRTMLTNDMKKYNNSIKGYMNLECSYERIKVDGNNQKTTNFSNKSETILGINDFIKDNFNELISREQRFAPNKGSGWSLLRCEKLYLKLNKYNVLNAGSYRITKSNKKSMY